MTDLLLPMHLAQARTRVNYIDATGMSRGTFGANPKTAARGGDRLGMNIELSGSGGGSTTGRSDRALIRSFLASLRGRQNRAYMLDTSNSLRGSFPTGELLTNNTFSSGTTGWQANSQAAISVSDRTLMLKVTTHGASVPQFGASPEPTFVQYAPYVFRGFFRNSSNASAKAGVFLSDGVQSSSTYSTTYGMHTTSLVALSTTVDTAVVFDSDDSVTLPGDYILVPYLSLSRCLRVDMGVNQFTRSDDQSHADWAAIGLASRTANYYADSLGGTTGTRLVEDTSTGGHSIHQDKSKSAVAQDWCLAGVFRRGDVSNLRDRVCLRVGDTAGTDVFQAIFDLTAGTVVSTSNSGVTTNARAAIVDHGGGLYYCAVIGRTDTETTVRGRVLLVSNPGSTSYTGDGVSNIGTWRLDLAPSSSFIRLTQTTSAAATGTSPTGSTMYVKGGPASAIGSLLVDDQFEVITSRGSELKILTAPVDFDAAGRGIMQFEPPLRGTVADNAPIIINQPMGRFLFTGEMVGWDNEPAWTSASAEFEEA